MGFLLTLTNRAGFSTDFRIVNYNRSTIINSGGRGTIRSTPTLFTLLSPLWRRFSERVGCMLTAKKGAKIAVSFN